MIIRRARTEDAAGITHVHATTWQTTYRGMVPDDYLDRIQVEAWEQRWARELSNPTPNVFVHVAADEEHDVIAGFVRGGITRYPDLPYKSELYAIYILQTYQQHGLGRRLVRALARDLQAAEMTDMLLWVFEENHASRHFYEAIGGQYLKTGSFEIMGVRMHECAYIWNDLGPLLAGEDL